jgi:cysteine dioxygenase
MSSPATLAVPPVLLPVVRYLDGLSDRAPLPELHALLEKCPVTLADLQGCAHFDAKHYCRNLVASGEWYSLLVICWRSGQRSPIHDHAGSSCAFKVLQGVCSETAYGFAVCGQVYPLETVDQPEGAIVATQDEDTHQVSNLQPAGQDLVTLHIYSPPLKSMHTFSLYGEGAANWRAPQGTAEQVAQVSEGEGI